MASKLAFVLLCAALVASCGTIQTEYIEVRPECTVPPQPALPQVDVDDLDSLPDDVYWRLETREKRLTDWALEMRGMLQKLCRPDAPDQ